MKLTKKQLKKLAEINNWAVVEYSNGNLIRSQTGGDNAIDWTPVTQSQIEEVLKRSEQ